MADDRGGGGSKYAFPIPYPAVNFWPTLLSNSDSSSQFRFGTVLSDWSWVICCFFFFFSSCFQTKTSIFSCIWKTKYSIFRFRPYPKLKIVPVCNKYYPASIWSPIPEPHRTYLYSHRAGWQTDGVFLLEVGYRRRLVAARLIGHRPHNNRWPVLIAADQFSHNLGVMVQVYLFQIKTGKK